MGRTLRSIALLLALVWVLGAQAQAQESAPTDPLSPPDDRFGVVLTGMTDDGQAAVALAEEILDRLGTRWWYTFPPGVESVPGTQRVQMARPSESIETIVARARQVPGSTWLVGNEPNVPGQDDVPPEPFAAWYGAVVTALRDADPASRIVGPNVLNWTFTCTRCAGFTPAETWSERFVAAHLERFGTLPDFDAWGMHAYDLDWLNPPLINPARSVEQIEAARRWLDGRGAYAAKPIWLTEFGVIYAFDRFATVQVDGETLIAASGQWRQDQLDAYMADMLGWLRGRGGELRVERWFLYSALPLREPYMREPGGLALFRGPEAALQLTPEGEAYAHAACPSSACAPRSTAAVPGTRSAPGPRSGAEAVPVAPEIEQAAPAAVGTGD